ncbi:MAG: T9SS type A sorting domain-containing protein, partial [Candidatus Cloacimonetes bacterium]|nr:T9SS type A sorting domain-containing protein [Candidatus Cloacimonadota bacterium]
VFNGNPLFLGTTTDTLSISQPEYYFLSSNSPCINTGTADTTGMNLPPMDLAGNHRIWDNRIDMGCYEYGSTPVSIINPEYPPLPDQIVMSIYPNPVYLSGSKGSYAFIEFILPEKAKEPPLVEIYNVKGQKVKSMRLTESYNSLVQKAGLSNQVKQNGEFYSTVWNCKNEGNQALGSGTYIIRITAGEYTGLKKIVIVK